MVRTPPTALTPAALIAEHMAALRATDRQLLAEQLDYEARATYPEEPPTGLSADARIAKWMNGFAAPAGLGLTGGQRLRQIIIDRQDIKAALSKLEIQRIDAQNIEDKAAAEAATPRWLADVRALVLAAERLRVLEERVQALRNQPGGNFLPLIEHFGGRSIIGARWDSDPASRARTALLQAGAITERDIEEMRRV